ncbi:hypothetical protein DOY81_010899 [Sarcophaga bullata]|nr:hypothetical protein DOY81_010899 [Sarcophaga bullata]
MEIDDSDTNNKANNGATDVKKEYDGKIDQYCTEEEYLVEETNCNEEYDCIDLNDTLTSYNY